MKILVIGDSCYDKYVRGTCDRLSPEFPVPVLKLANTSYTSLGMAANVKANLEAFGCKVDLITQQELITKTRFVEERTGHHLLRVDDEWPVTPFDRKQFSDHRYDCIVISDYNKGFLSEADIVWIRKTYMGPIFLDTKKTDLAMFEGCIVKINELEYKLAKTYCSELIVTHGKYGASYEARVFEAPEVEVHDVCGAGDTFLAALAFRFTWMADTPDAIKFANKAAAITVQHRGVYVLTPEDILSL